MRVLLPVLYLLALFMLPGCGGGGGGGGSEVLLPPAKNVEFTPNAPDQVFTVRVTKGIQGGMAWMETRWAANFSPETLIASSSLVGHPEISIDCKVLNFQKAAPDSASGTFLLDFHCPGEVSNQLGVGNYQIIVSLVADDVESNRRYIHLTIQ